jgi:hypothetical protein
MSSASVGPFPAFCPVSGHVSGCIPIQRLYKAASPGPGRELNGRPACTVSLFQIDVYGDHPVFGEIVSEQRAPDRWPLTMVDDLGRRIRQDHVVRRPVFPPS